LARQLIPSKLNAVLNGSSGVQSVIDAADLLIGDLSVPPFGNGHIRPAITSPLIEQLDAHIQTNSCDKSGE
jgi:hypothetical protein